MGFSVTAANVIFAVALLSAFSAASTAYWRTQAELEEARRVMDERVVEAVHTNLSITRYSWNNGAKTLEIDLKNTGIVTVDHTYFQYLLDGTIHTGAMSAGFPKLNGNPMTGTLVNPGETFNAKWGLSGQPTNVHIVAENGISAHYP